MSFGQWLRRVLFLLLMVVLLGSSSLPPGDSTERVRAFTRGIEFDYVSWTAGALAVKFAQASLGAARYLPAADQRQVVLDAIDLIARIHSLESEVYAIYADPGVDDPEAASAELRAQLQALNERHALLGPLAEAILQAQLSEVVADLGLATGGQPLPPVLYRASELPVALIVSPRDVIRQDAQVSLSPGLTLEEQVKLEEQVDAALDVSSLVEDIGGVGVYPTMVMQTSDLNWLAEVVAHEWTHNFLTLRPLGINYLTSPELRTMNETAANIAGKELSRTLIARYYPELLPPEAPPQAPAGEPAASPPPFDFRAEMHQTRLVVDELLQLGDIEGAEQYMEVRRILFWENGYRIRKLNQAYFAFHGAYADEAQGAAGADPIGAAVRKLRASSPSLSSFLKRLSWMWSYSQLQSAVGETP
ncbi:MAG: hypothetical protein PHS96_09485 [Anaerolineales bacterium]|nr:hypothetical protein [Anaerolineales bacterium]